MVYDSPEFLVPYVTMCVAGTLCEFDHVDDAVIVEIIKRLSQVEQVARAACISRRWNNLLKQVGEGVCRQRVVINMNQHTGRQSGQRKAI